ncbi:carotenoid oxygenase family protein [Pseudenhygromyxa sp. WMMC2535]|uniref:carotenoid oxygenase family protein n=1 Tax=Pseudenhygromyxa sp. WMMC2535 TaxID=2712867 RepID=UPI001551751E|nr:carotenoid oxygenase family protein [Pseudenhygromyxa sp. WMMC2535]NVB40447.1 carotenoid oxygenase family protein [Pseudenhygromyxa sp. WMMC2535]
MNDRVEAESGSKPEAEANAGAPRSQDFRRARAAIRSLAREHGPEQLELEGSLPEGLRGTLFRNGPAALSSYGDRYGHWFDGDGAVSATRIADGRVTGAVRYVETPDRAEERVAKRRLFANFGTPPPSLRSHLRGLREGRVKHAANTSVLPWRERLFALHEGSPPYELDPHSLETLGVRDLGGIVGRAFSAHPHRVAARSTTYGYGLSFDREGPRIDVFALPDDPRQGPARTLTRVALRRPTMIHDFVASERHLLFLIAPVVLRPLALALTGRAYVDALAWRPELGTEIIAVPIDEPARIRRFSVDPCFAFHFANAFEDGEKGEDRLIVDFVRYPDFPSINEWILQLTRPAPIRAAIDGELVRGRLDLRRESLELEAALHPSCEFPRVAPGVEGSRYRYAYLGCHAQTSGVRPGLQDHLTKVDLDTGRTWAWDFGAETYPSEAVFVPDPARAGREDGGWLLSIVYDGRRDRSCLVVVDAEAPGRPPLARAWYDQGLPATFHGNFAPS